MKQKTLLLVLSIVALVVFGIIMTVQNSKLQASLKSTKTELEDTQENLQEANTKLTEISEKLRLSSSSAEDIGDKVDNIQTYASELESSIDDLLRVIRWADCDACQDKIWDIEKKAKAVESDFESLQSEIN